jgi:hypothetical protein
MRSSPLQLLALSGAALVAGCGGGGAGTASRPADEGSKPPDRVLADAAAALRRVRSYHIEGTQTDKGGISRVTGDVAAGRVRLSIRQGTGTVDLVAIGAETYIRANRTFWLEHMPRTNPRAQAIASALGGRWIRPPASATRDLGSIAIQSRPASLAHCLTRETGTLGTAGSATVDGRTAVVVTAKGDVPGSTPGVIYVAASTPHLPLRVIQTGRRRRGGTFDPLCDERTPSTVAEDLRLAAFDRPVRIAAPAGAIDLSKLGQAASAS